MLPGRGIRSPELGERMKKARLEMAIPQMKMAKHIGVTPGMIGLYEKGLATPSPETLKKWAELSKVPLEYLTEVVAYRDTGFVTAPKTS